MQKNLPKENEQDGSAEQLHGLRGRSLSKVFHCSAPKWKSRQCHRGMHKDMFFWKWCSTTACQKGASWGDSADKKSSSCRPEAWCSTAAGTIQDTLQSHRQVAHWLHVSIKKRWLTTPSKSSRERRCSTCHMESLLLTQLTWAATPTLCSETLLQAWQSQLPLALAATLALLAISHCLPSNWAPSPWMDYCLF